MNNEEIETEFLVSYNVSWRDGKGVYSFVDFTKDHAYWIKTFKILNSSVTWYRLKYR